MKTVFTSDEIAHVWAHSLAPSGRSPGNASFGGDAFRSYATVIARRIEHNGRTAFILDRASFSITTSKIQGRVWRAVPPDELGLTKTFHIYAGERGQSLYFTPQTLRDFYVNESKEIETREPSRLARLRASQYLEATASLRKAVEVCEFFGLPFLGISRQIDKREARNAEAAQLVKDAADARERAKELKRKKDAKAQAERNVKMAEEYLTDPAAKPIFNIDEKDGALAMLSAGLREKFLAKVKAVNAGAFDAWHNGADVRLPYDCPVLLRVESPVGDDDPTHDGKEMVTSKGARIPLADAKRAFLFVSKVRAIGWHKNGETFAIGGYWLDAVNDAGVVAGCHRLTWAEIERFAESQGWAD